MVAPISWQSFEQPQSVIKKLPEQTQEAQEPQQNLSWGNFQNSSTYQGKIDPTADESTFGYLARNVVSNAARATERFLGKYGDIQKYGTELIKRKPESLGILGNALHELMGNDKWNIFVGGEKPGTPQLPTSENLRTLTEAATGEYTKPKTRGEEITQNILGDIAGTGRRMPQASRNRRLLNNMGIPIAANAAKEVVEDLGFGEDKATWTKMAAWTGLSLLNGVNAPAYAANLMNQGRQGFGQNVVAQVPRYEGGINVVARNMLQGDPRSTLAQQQIAGIRNDIANGQLTMNDLMNRYDAINAAKRDRGLFELNRGDRRAAIHNINQVRDAVRNEIEVLGRSNPQALQAWQNGVQAFSTIHRSNAISNFARSHLTGNLAKTTMAGLFGAGIFKAPLLTTSVGAVLPPAYKISQVGFRVWADPTLSHYYWNAMRAAAQENGPVFIQNYNKLNDNYNKKYKD